jgi:hypothetical protein
VSEKRGVEAGGCGKPSKTALRPLTAQKYVRMGQARKASLAKVSHLFSLPDEVDDLLAKLIVRGVDRQGCRLVIVSGEAQKSWTL